MGTQNCTSKLHNLSCWIPILKCDTSTSLWLDSLIFCIKLLLLKEGQIFYPFSCSNFPSIQGLLEWEPKTALLEPITLSPILKCDTSINLWMNFLITCIQILLVNEGRNFDPFSCSIFPYFQWVSEWEPKTALLDSITCII